MKNCNFWDSLEGIIIDAKPRQPHLHTTTCLVPLCGAFDGKDVEFKL